MRWEGGNLANEYPYQLKLVVGLPERAESSGTAKVLGKVAMTAEMPDNEASRFNGSDADAD